MNKNRFPEGWDEERVRRVLEHYEAQTVAEDEAAYDQTDLTTMRVPVELVPAVRQLIAEKESDSGS